MLFTPIIDDIPAMHHCYIRTSVMAYYGDMNATDYTPIALDQQRMNKAINANRVALPKGLDKSQIHAFLINQAKQLAK